MAEQLKKQGHAVSHVTVARCLHEMGYSLQANVKTVAGTQHEDRDQQFRYINKQVSRFLRARDPVVSVDTKKKELVGSFKNQGRRWKTHGHPDAVNVHDFPSMAVGKAIPYGTYDIGRDEAVVNVGITHETAEFAVASIRRWWQFVGRTGISQGAASPHLRRCRGKQRESSAGVESPPPKVVRSVATADHGVSLPARHE